jgi:hypothetical protein
MSARPRIYVDFNKLDQNQSAILTCIGTLNDLESQGIVLREGLEVRIYMPDDVDERGDLDSLEVDAVVHYNAQLRCWVAAYDWDQLKYRSGINQVSPNWRKQ